jgi:hypothetical protein
MSYARFGFYTDDVTQLCEWVNRELVGIEDALRKLELVEYHVVPEKPFNGLKVIADGTDWNPGSGRGVYWYDGDTSSWKFLG